MKDFLIINWLPALAMTIIFLCISLRMQMITLKEIKKGEKNIFKRFGFAAVFMVLAVASFISFVFSAILHAAIYFSA